MGQRLAGKVAIVTGAGSRGPGLGNGKAAAILFAREGARVLCVDLVKERAEETAAIIAGEGGEAAAFAADVTRVPDCEDMVAEARRRWGGVDVLHNNVGIESRRDLVETQEEEWDRVMAVDLKSMFLATRTAVPVMERRGGGSVVCVSSIAGMRGHGRTAYATAKAGVIGFVRSVAVQLGPKGIRVNAIAPGAVATPLTAALRTPEGSAGIQAMMKSHPSPSRRFFMEPSEIASLAAFLASDASSALHGAVLIADQGLSATMPA